MYWLRVLASCTNPLKGTPLHLTPLDQLNQKAVEKKLATVSIKLLHTYTGWLSLKDLIIPLPISLTQGTPDVEVFSRRLLEKTLKWGCFS